MFLSKTNLHKKLHGYVHVAVPNRNRILLCCVFQAHHQVCRVLSRWASTKGRAHTRWVNAGASMKHVWAPPSAEAKCNSTSNSVMCSKQNNIRYQFGIATHIHICTNAKITCWTEEEDVWLVQVWVDVIGDCHLGVGKGGELLCVSWTHVTVDVIKEDCKRAAAQSSYLPTRMHTNNSELKGKTLGNPLQFWQHVERRC